MKLTLRIAAVYNILWGAWCILFPNHLFDLVGMDRLNHPMVWQGLGMVIGLYGLAYWWASYDPVKYWSIVAVGLLGKIFGPAGFVFNYLLGIVSIGFGYTLITNDIIWWVPFGHILHRAYKETGFRL